MAYPSFFMIDFFVLLIVLIITFYIYYTRHFNYWKKQKIPYVKPNLFFGNFIRPLTFRKTLAEEVEKIYNQSKSPYVGVFMCDVPSLFIRDLDLIKSVLIKDFNYFADRSARSDRKTDPIGSYMLFFLDSPDWRHFRTKLSPIFSTAKIKKFYSLIENCGKDLVKHLDESIGDSSTVQIKDVAYPFTTQVIISVAFGIDENCFGNESEFLKTAYGLFNMSDPRSTFQLLCYMIAPTLVKLLKLKVFKREPVKFVKQSFLNVVNMRSESDPIRNDLVDFLIKIKNDRNINDAIDFNDDTLVAQALQFFTAGFETTSGTLGYLFYELSHNAEVQTRLRKEIVSCLEKSEGKIEFDSLKEMKYLDMCLKEGLRKYPVLPFLERRAMRNYNLPGTDITIHKDFSVMVSLLGLHYDPEHFPNPHQFDPERFSEVNEPNLKPYSYMPFGAGPRNCIGGKFAYILAKAFICTILPKYEVLPKTPKVDRLEFHPRAFFLTPKTPIYIELKKIK